MQKVQVLLEDDLSGGKADGTVRFGLDGTEFEIDLTKEHEEEFRDALAKYVSAGRAVPQQKRPGPARRSPGRHPGRNPDTAKIRAWAKEQGIEISDRGRIPADVQQKYEARKSGPNAPGTASAKGGNTGDGSGGAIPSPSFVTAD